jgi:hypothetical protein
VERGYDALAEHLRLSGPSLLFVWMSLIFLNTHLKDRNLRYNRDLRSSPDPISDLYDWERLHHVHAVARSFYTGCTLTTEVFGSCIMVPIRADMSRDRFDFADLYWPQSILLRLGSIGFLTMLNDSCAVANILQPRLEKIGGELSEIQFRELFADIAFTNLYLKVRPEYRTEIHPNGFRKIIADHPPTCELDKPDMKTRGALLLHLLGDYLPHFQPLRGSREELLSNVEDGLASFLLDSDDEFISTPAVRLPLP